MKGTASDRAVPEPSYLGSDRLACPLVMLVNLRAQKKQTDDDGEGDSLFTRMTPRCACGGCGACLTAIGARTATRVGPF
jgi:hypothetical protein